MCGFGLVWGLSMCGVREERHAECGCTATWSIVMEEVEGCHEEREGLGRQPWGLHPLKEPWEAWAEAWAEAPSRLDHADHPKPRGGLGWPVK